MTTARGHAEPCRWCGAMHPELRCPKIRAVEFHPDGTIKRVEFLTPADAALGFSYLRDGAPRNAVPGGTTYIEGAQR